MTPAAWYGPSHAMDLIELTFDTEHLPVSRVGKGRGRVLPRKNAYFAVDQKTGRPYLTAIARDFRRSMRTRAIAAGIMDPFALTPVISSGWWVLELLVIAGRRSLSLDVLLPLVDSDGCLSPVKDALAKCTGRPTRGGPEMGAIIDNDARIVSDSTAIACREGRPGLRVRLVRVRDPQAVLAVRWPGVRFMDAL